eukprot:TRINITY_DN76922_c0_g1_i1.p1 TRINITY_DN76922_c0_g1~~TRINITY_DN76922_c0_g1_i1.p1  ORF type:complete len:426 (+),score=101.54 TRINITY_DN76922_c0_g1_i1:28-1278(+)
MTGASSYPVAPPLNWHRSGFPQRSKAYADTRPSDFLSFKEIAGREDLLRLIVGRLMTSDGEDMQDDYTIPIEKQFWDKPLEWIVRHTYCQVRGLQVEAKVSVKFMLPEAGAGLGWLDVELSPRDLKLKDSDIVEVLVADRSKPEMTDSARSEQAELTRDAALQLFEQGAEPRRVWRALWRFAEDDNVVAPGLELLARLAARQPTSVFTVAGQSIEELRLLLRLLGELHSSNRQVQAVGWRLLTEACKEASLRPGLQRGGARSLALRLQRAGDLHGEGEEHVAHFLQLLGPMPSVQGANAAKEASLALAKPNGGYPACGEETQALSASQRWQREAARAAVRLERAMHKEDSMDIEKALHHLIAKMRGRDTNWQSVEEAGIGQLLGQLQSFDGDADVKSLAKKAVLEAGKLQHADCIR